MKTPRHLPHPRKTRGAVIILFGLMLVVLLGFAGLAIDLGRFFIVRAELQNAVDACALAAASQLRPGQNDPSTLTRAVDYGRVFSTGGVPSGSSSGFPLDAIRNKVNFQSAVVDIQSSHISFSATLGGSYQTADVANPATANYAKCEYPFSSLPIYFMRVLNLVGADFSTQTVSAMAAAIRGSGACNVIGVGVCQVNANPDRGLVKGNWLTFSDTLVAGWFGWMDYSPKAGGTKELLGLMTDVGQCIFPSGAIGADVTEPGKKSAAEEGWNTRFGIYKKSGKYDVVNAPPDHTGFAYYGEPVGTTLVANWPRLDSATTPRAYDQTHPGAPGIPSFQSAQMAFRQYEQTTDMFNPVPTLATSSQHHFDGRKDRRIVITPVVDCSTREVTALGCSFMLNPFGQVSGPGGGPVDGKLEYLGLVTDSGSPCGSDISIPLMSVLVK